ncbi:type II toxin-antitoxin system PemK/MazF family toxin [Alkalinema pantanalense CENA528]|uniref:type II toxin-antitoxin system PemK/MazF family toxin n=1 Tax=Alkalinema pantanalense TaxID=1620705 RepID=UPI003D6FEF49
MALDKGDIILAQFPFTDLSQTKLRPAIVLHASVEKNEITVCFISSQKVNQLSDSEFALLDTDRDFALTGLKVSSKVRVTRIVTVNAQLISRKLGYLGINYTQILDQKLKQTLKIP